MDGSVLAVLAAYQNNLVTSKMLTSQVAQWFPTLTSGNTTLDGKELISTQVLEVTSCIEVADRLASKSKLFSKKVILLQLHARPYQI